MHKLLPALLVFLLFFTGCMKNVLPPVSITVPERKIDYLTEVKPLLDRRCVVCHSCYNSPCQLKLSSYEGVDRGASKEQVYDAHRRKTMEPTRLFIDAVNTEEWRDKDFFSVTDSSVTGNSNDSLLLQLLAHKMDHPVSQGEYKPEEDLTCAKNGAEVSAYLDKHPNRGMPFGFPPLEQHEFLTIAGWLVQGAHGPTAGEQQALRRSPAVDRDQLARWEHFFNREEPKYQVTARYLYEHLFLAHINFSTESGTFYELVRSKTPPGEEIVPIATLRPYDYPGATFYYRFQKIHSTIVHKTHMVLSFDETTLVRLYQLFIEPDWLEEPRAIELWGKEAANPFVTFAQIPSETRYRFLLDNIHYIIMTFIRGPVCKGQVALNVIHDHFWLLFLDPEYDLTVQYPAFLKLHRDKLAMPAELGSRGNLLTALTNPHHELAMEYHRARQDFYMAHYYNGMDYTQIWKGERPADSPLLTVFRHFDSASVHRGALGSLPRTVWVMDYPLIERVYYSLVAGFDVYGKVWHQLTTRFYMDALRREGEANFLAFMPQTSREAMMKSWYRGMDFFHVRYHATEMVSPLDGASLEPKREFLQKVINTHFPRDLHIGFDPINANDQQANLEDLAEITTREEVFQALHSVAGPGNSFFSQVADHNANVAYIRVRMPEGDDLVISAVVHRWHDNVTFLFGEERNLDATRDSADFFAGFIGSYPNYFFDVDISQVHEFAALLRDYRGTDADIKRLMKFGINRSNPSFWEVYDWFQESFNRSDPLRSGLFDLNRYYHSAL